MDLTIQKLMIAVIVVAVGAAYLIAGIIASDRFGRRSQKIERLITRCNLCFSLIVIFWPLIGIVGTIYFWVMAYSRVPDFKNQKNEQGK